MPNFMLLSKKERLLRNRHRLHTIPAIPVAKPYILREPRNLWRHMFFGFNQ